ncbi:MAG: DUF4198 domain-containing protein [Luminiphilus sp.]
MKVRLVITAITMTLLGASVSAHDITMYPIKSADGVKLDVYFGDPGEYVRIDKRGFIELIAFDSDDNQVDLAHLVLGDDQDVKKLWTQELALDDLVPGTILLGARYDNGFALGSVEGRSVRTTLRQWGKEVSFSKRLLKFAKALLYTASPSGGYDRVLGHRVEFVPLANPFLLEDGAELPVQLLVDGAPKPNHKVHIGDETSAQLGPDVYTDVNGVFPVRLDHAGFYRLAVDYTVNSARPELSLVDEYTASLVFRR